MATVDHTNQIEKLYIAYFGRPGDKAGVDYWNAEANANGGNFDSLYLNFSLSDEYKSLHSGQSNTALINSLYQYLFGHDADFEGLNYWGSQLLGGYPINKIAAAIVGGAQTADAAILTNKAAAATTFTLHLDTSAEVLGYDGSAAFTSARAFITSVTATATTDAAVDAAIATAIAAGQSTGFALTNGTDVNTGNIFNADMVYTPSGTSRINSLQDEDTLTGTGNNPTLNATLGNTDGLNAGASALIITPKLTGIETINVGFTGSGAAVAVNELDLQDSTAPKAVNIVRVSDGIATATIDNLKGVPADLSVTDSNNAQQSVAFQFTNGGAAGTADTTKLTLNNVNVFNLSVQENITDGARNQGIETINLVSSSSANTVTVLTAEDLATLNISGDKNLTIGGEANVNGSLSKVDASTLAANLTFTVTNGVMSTTPDGATSGNVAFALLSGKGDDAIRVSEQIGTNDTFATGEGTDTLRLSSGNIQGPAVVQTRDTIALNAAADNVTGVENIQLWKSGGAVTTNADGSLAIAGVNTVLALRADEATGDQSINLKDSTNFSANTTTYNVVNLTAAEATSISITHSGSDALVNPAAASNSLANNLVDLDVATGVTAVNMTLLPGVNSDARFNFQLYTDSDRALGTTAATATAFSTLQDAGTVNAVTGLTLTDSDTESNTVMLLADGYSSNVAQGNGTAYTSITLKGGTAGQFLNLDATGNVYGLAVDGTPAVGAVADRAGLVDNFGTAAERLSAATINASEHVGNVIVRVGTNFNDVDTNGAQAITMGSGNDTVLFDFQNNANAGLTIADTVIGGTGTDTLMLEGNEAVKIGTSEWTNVSGFEEIRLVGNAVPANNAVDATNSYNLVLTNELIDLNAADGNRLLITNDSDTANDMADSVAADLGNNEGGLTIDATGLNSSNSFNYNGEEGATRTADRFIFKDTNIKGLTIIDGGAVDNVTTNHANGAMGNDDVIEVQNSAFVDFGDLIGVKNVGTLSFTSVGATTSQVSRLQLNDATVDALVDSYQASVSRAATAPAVPNVEKLVVNGIDNMSNAAYTVGLNIEAAGLTDKSDLSVTLGRGANNVATGGGQDTVVLLGNYVAGTYAGSENGVNLNTQSTAGAAARIVTDKINLGGGIDTLVTYGALNVVGAQLAGIETVVAHSDLTMSAVQYNALVAARAVLALTGPVVTFTGAGEHTLTITGPSTGTIDIDLSRITLNAGSGNLSVNTVNTGTGVIYYDPTRMPVDTDAPGVGGDIFVNAAMPTYALTPPATSINEGATATFSLATTNVAVGTVLNYTLSGTGITTADVTPASLSGTVTVTGATTSVPVNIAADVTTEGTETLTMTIMGSAANVTVNDTSLTGGTAATTVLPVGTTTTVTATAAAENFSFNVAGAKAIPADTQIPLSGFDVTLDTLVLDLVTANPALTKLSMVHGVEGIAVELDPFTGLTLINFGNDTDGQAITVSLLGVVDATLVNVSVI